MGAENVARAYAITASSSKLASDKVFVAANNLSGDIGTRFSVVRYDDATASSG
jgi:UDP-N-acetylglucosamine 4,6-dehydratase